MNRQLPTGIIQHDSDRLTLWLPRKRPHTGVSAELHQSLPLYIPFQPSHSTTKREVPCSRNADVTASRYGSNHLQGQNRRTTVAELERGIRADWWSGELVIDGDGGAWGESGMTGYQYDAKDWQRSESRRPGTKMDGQALHIRKSWNCR